jgi:predicted dehydrogenase
VTARYIPGASDDTTTVMLRFESGATGLIFCSVATATNFSFTLYGTKGLAEISKPSLQTFRFVPASDVPPTGQVTAPPDQIAEHPTFDMLQAQMIAFADSIRERKPYPVPIADVLHGMAVFDAIVESAATGKIVEVAQPN